MQWRNGNAMSCNLITSGFDSRLHVQDRSRSSTGRASGFYPQGSGFESSREHQFVESEREGSRAPPAKRPVPHGMSIVRSALRHLQTLHADLGHWLIARLPSAAKEVRFLQSAPLRSSTGQDLALSKRGTGIETLTERQYRDRLAARVLRFERRTSWVRLPLPVPTPMAGPRWRGCRSHKATKPGSSPGPATNIPPSFRALAHKRVYARLRRAMRANPE